MTYMCYTYMHIYVILGEYSSNFTFGQICVVRLVCTCTHLWGVFFWLAWSIL